MDPNNWNNGMANNQSNLNGNYVGSNQNGWTNPAQQTGDINNINNPYYQNQYGWNDFTANHETRSSLPNGMGGKKNALGNMNIVALIFGGVAVILVIIACFVYSSEKKFKSKAVDVEAVITRIDTEVTGSGKNRTTSHVAYVDYEFENEYYYDVRLSFYSSNMRRGQTITVLIDPEKPYNAKAKSGMMFVPIVLGIMAIVFMIVTGIIIAVDRKGNYKK